MADQPPVAESQLLEPPTRLWVPLRTREAGDGTPGDAVLLGESVAKGQPVARSAAEAGPAALAPTSGRVVGTDDVDLTNGRRVPAALLEVDHQDRSPPDQPHDPGRAAAHRKADQALDKVKADDLGRWIDRLRAAGVWADRSTSPDLLAQLHQVLRRPVDTVLCNLVDHEPGVRLQASVARRSGPMLVAGVDLLARLTNARNVWVAVEAGGPVRWWAPLRDEVREAGIEIVPVLPDYPQADPTLLVHTLLRRGLRPGRLPVEQGVLLLDAVAAVAVGRAARRQRPMLHTPLAVRDHVALTTHYLAAAVGTPLRHVLAALGLRADDLALLRGDLLRGQRVSADAVVCGGECVFHVLPVRTPVIPDPCIRCGWCAQHCPTRVQPAGVLEAAQAKDPELAERYGAGACIECGVCSFVCPSHLPLLEGIRGIKGG